MSDVEREVRDVLQEMADDVHVPPVAPPAVLRRAAFRRAATVVLAGGAVAALAVGIVLGRNLLPDDVSAPRPRLASNVAPRVVSTLRLATHPAQIAVGHGAVWVVNEDDGSRTRIDPATGAVREDAAHEVSGLTVAGDEVVTYGSEIHSSVVLRLAPDGSGKTLGRVPLPDGAEYDVGRVATSPGAIWVARWTHDGSQPGQLFQIDPASDSVLKTIALPSPEPGGLAVGEGAVWVTSNDGGTLLRVSLASGEASSPVRLGGDLVDVVTGYRSVWVSDAGRRKILRIDPVTLRTMATVSVPGGAGWLAAGAGGVWTVADGRGIVSWIDPSTNAVGAPGVRIGGAVDRFGGIAVGEGGVWISNTRDRSVVQVRLAPRSQTPTVTPVPPSAPFAIWPEDTVAAAHQADLTEDAWRADPAEVARLFGREVLGWRSASATPYAGPIRCESCYVVARGSSGPRVRVDLVKAPGTEAWFVRSVGDTKNGPDGLSVSVRGSQVLVGFARRGAAEVEVQIGYAGRDLSTRVAQGTTATLALDQEPVTSGHLLLLFRDGEGRVFFARGVALPSGAFAAG